MTLSKFEQTLFVIVTLLWLNACDAFVNSENTANHEIETVSIDQGDGDSFTVHLDPSIVPTRRFFDDLDNLHHFMDSIDAGGQVFLNKNLYLRLNHALHPSEIAALDMEGTAIVGEYKYVVSEETVSRANLLTNQVKWEVETYYGIDGDVDFKEFEILARNVSNMDELKNFIFKDPDIRSLYVDLRDKASAKTSNYDYAYYGPLGAHNFPFDNPYTGKYNSPPSGIHHRGYYFWNVSTGRFRRRASAYTGLRFRPVSSISWYSPHLRYYGLHLPSYTTTNYVETTLNAGYGNQKCTGTYECGLTIRRKKRRGATSLHSSGYKYTDGTGTSDPRLPNAPVTIVYDVHEYSVK